MASGTAVASAVVPSASSLWTGDPSLEPLLEQLHKAHEGKLAPKECVGLLRQAEWRLGTAVALGSAELQRREIEALEKRLADANGELAEYEENRAEHDAAVHAQAMEDAHEYSNKQEAIRMEVNDRKVAEYVARIGEAEAAQIAAEARAERAEATVVDAEERQAAAVAGYKAEVERLEAALEAREALRDENVKLELELAALRLGGRAEKMAIADAYEEELAMSRILWEMCGPSDGREVWAEADKRQLDAVGETLREQLDHARGAYGALVAQLWEYNARAQALSRALGVPDSGVEQLAEEARRVRVGPADVDRIARELVRMDHAEQRCADAVVVSTKALAAATEAKDEVDARVTALEAQAAELEEEHPGIFEPKSEAEAAESGGKLTKEEIGAADLIRRLTSTRTEAERLATAQAEKAAHKQQCEAEHSRTTLARDSLRTERSYWRDGLTLPQRIERSGAREQELSAQYEETSAKMVSLHEKIRWLWCDRLGHAMADLALEYHPLAGSELLSCTDGAFAKAERLKVDLEALVAQRRKDLLASRRRMESLVQQLKSMTWLWNRGADRLKGWQHDEALRSLLEESEPPSFDGNTSDTSRPRLIWAQEREKRLIATKQEAEAAARSMQG